MTSTTADALPDLPADLSERQARGADCVWCRRPLTAGAAVDLSERVVGGVRQFPRGCLPCTGHWAFEALLAHVAKCDLCHLTVADCDEGRALQRLIKRGRAHEWARRQA
ncbi:hypothetical protein ACIQU5_29070 [Streptomyces sp. NPDC090306]|uniref:hypothetical protein n=1 Tax=unclassified Streptomyces TaxID=2593676 RepID=UPI0036EF7E3A